MTQDTIVVGVDESPQARTALRWAAELARSSGSRLVGLHVLHWPKAEELYAYGVMADRVFGPDDQLDAFYRAPSEAAFAAVDPEPGWELRFAEGHAGRVLVQESRDARMLVLGTREHTGVLRLLVGSTGHYCLNHVRCPLVAVPTTQEAEPDAVPAGSATASAG